MLRRQALAIALLFVLAVPSAFGHASTAIQSRTARGVVFHDRNGNGRRDAGEPGLAGVAVSNQRDIVVTDRQGRYELPVDEDTIIFVLKPRGWTPTLTSDGRPQFYYIHKPAGSPPLQYAGVPPTGPLPPSIDFPLRPSKEPDTFRVLMLGDTQTTNQTEVDYLAHDIVESLAGLDVAFGVVLGDNVNNDLSVFPALIATLRQTGFPWVHVGGNHDMNQDAPSDELSDETFERHFGPPHYAFDYGPVHFIVLENIMWRPKTENTPAGYTAGLGARQLEFLRNDLARVPKDRLVVLMMHIPIVAVAEREQIYRLLEDRPYTFSLSAHTHTQEHLFLDASAGWKGSQPHHHLIHGTACGSWWSGAPDEYGIPHSMMSDGTPNGYSIITFRKNRYEIEYRPARRPADYRMRIYVPEEVEAQKLSETEVIVNVFAGSSRSRVEMRIGESGTWTVMEQVRAVDPAFAALKELEKSNTPPPGKRLPGASTCSHLWKANLPGTLPVGHHLVTVRTTDMFGKTYEAHRVFRVR